MASQIIADYLEFKARYLDLPERRCSIFAKTFEDIVRIMSIVQTTTVLPRTIETDVRHQASSRINDQSVTLKNRAIPVDGPRIDSSLQLVFQNAEIIVSPVEVELSA